MESEILNIALLALVQGVTEFLPVSSSGHLVIFQHLLGIKEDNLYIAVILHAGTLFSIIAFYFKDLLQLLKLENFKIVVMIVVGTLPLIIGGLMVKPIMETYFSSLWVAGIGLALTATMLLLLYNSQSHGKELNEMLWYEALTIGLFQCLAITPGISRSGSTISIASRLGFGGKTAAKFSFFLGIPGILGANVLTIYDIYKEHLAGAPPVTIAISTTIIGFLLSFGIGYLALKLLIHTLTTNRFSYFGYYCLIVSIGIILMQIFT